MSRAGPSSAARVSLGDVAASILDASLPGGDAPILARRKGPERRIAEAKAEEREQSAVSRAKRALAEQPHQALRKTANVQSTDLVLETSLRKIATRGVVQLFNAVRTAQKTDDGEDGVSKKKAKREKREEERAASRAEASAGGAAANLSKDSFLDILRRGNAPPSKGRQGASAAPAGGSGDASGASFLRDDYMLGKNRAKDWEREEDDDDETGYELAHGARGADDDDDDDDE